MSTRWERFVCRVLGHDEGDRLEEPKRLIHVVSHRITGDKDEYMAYEIPRYVVCARCGEHRESFSRYEKYPVGDIKALRDLVLGADLSDDGTFRRVVTRVVEDLGLQPGELGDALSVSRPTVTRWMGGHTAPHPAMREPVRRYALRKIAGLLGEIDTSTTESP